MDVQFTPAELQFVADGGNLWYLNQRRDSAWEIVRWSVRERHRIGEPIPSMDRAREHLFELIRPSSFRARTAIHHGIARSPVQLQHFPLLQS